MDRPAVDDVQIIIIIIIAIIIIRNRVNDANHLEFSFLENRASSRTPEGHLRDCL